MRKVLVGIVIGLALSFPLSIASAEIVSMIGKTVEGSYPVEMNDGTRAEKDAVVIEGTSYLPVRVISEMFDSDVAFIDSKIIITPRGVLSMTQADKDAVNKKLAEQAATEQAAMDKKTREANELQKKKNDLIDAQTQLQREEYQLNAFTKMLNDFKPNPNIPASENESAKAKLETKIQEVKSNINVLTDKITTLEAELK